MNGKAYLAKQIKSMQYLQEAVFKDLEDEQLAQKPPGTVSPIGVIWLHMVNGEDMFVATLMGGESLWKSGGWKERFGLEKAPNFGEDWTEYQQTMIPVELLQAYTEAVREQTNACLNVTSDEILEETVKFFSDNDPKADVWVLLVTHTLTHCGEIAAIRGVQGEKGLPF